MKNLILLVAAVMCVFGMSMKAQAGVPDLKKVENEVKQRMTEFITTCRDYNNVEQQENQPDFMTNDYNEKFIACIQRAGEENMPWPDFDPWIDAQDFDNVSFTIKSIKAIDKDNAVMTLVAENLGEVMEKIVKWVREEGVMKIDDFTTSGTYMRDVMDEFLE